MNIESIVAFTTIVLIIALIPGPNALLVLYTALANRKRQAFANVARVASGFFVHASISSFGLSLLLAQSSLAFNGLKWLGVAYLFWLGWSNFRAGFNQMPLVSKGKSQQEGLTGNYIKGLMTNMLNPKIVLFYLSIFPQFVRPETLLIDSLLLGSIQVLVVSSWFFVVIMLARSMRSFVLEPANARWLNYLSGTAFAGYGLHLASSKL